MDLSYVKVIHAATDALVPIGTRSSASAGWLDDA